MQEQSDAVFPFAFESLPVRGEIVQLQSAWRRMQLGHNYAAPVREVLGHAAAAAGLISQSLKFNGKITLQISGCNTVLLQRFYKECLRKVQCVVCV